MKKNKIIVISLLSLLLLMPFMTTTRAQSPSYVGVEEGEIYEFALNVYGANWVQWGADNMTAWWDAAWTHGPLYHHDKLYGDTAGWTPVTPQLIFSFDIESIAENATAGQTEVNSTFGTYVVFFPSASYDASSSVPIGNDTAKFAADSLYGGMSTSGYWILGIPFAPIGVNWTEFVALGTWGLDTGYWNITNPNEWNYTLTMTEIPNGYSLFSPAMGFGNNSLSITITTTYDSDGVLSYHSFEYGTNMLYDYVPTDTIDPVVIGAPPDFAVAHNYTGETISWVATDTHPDTYTITRNGSEVEPATAWFSGVAVQYDVQDGLSPGDYAFEITFEDVTGNTFSDEVIMTVNPEPPAPGAPPIPGYDIPIVLGVIAFATISIILLKKKKNG